jgi:hypothetical protein
LSLMYKYYIISFYLRATGRLVYFLLDKCLIIRLLWKYCQFGTQITNLPHQDFALAWSSLPTEYWIGEAGCGVCVLHMPIPKGNVQPFIVGGCHIAVGLDPVNIGTRKVPIGYGNAL